MRGRFEDIEAWKAARSLTNEVYKVTDLRGRNLSNEVKADILRCLFTVLV